MADTLGDSGEGVRGGVSGVIGAAAGFNALPVVIVVTDGADALYHGCNLGASLWARP